MYFTIVSSNYIDNYLISCSNNPSDDFKINWIKQLKDLSTTNASSGLTRMMLCNNGQYIILGGTKNRVLVSSGDYDGRYGCVCFDADGNTVYNKAFIDSPSRDMTYNNLCKIQNNGEEYIASTLYVWHDASYIGISIHTAKNGNLYYSKYLAESGASRIFPSSIDSNLLYIVTTRGLCTLDYVNNTCSNLVLEQTRSTPRSCIDEKDSIYLLYQNRLYKIIRENGNSKISIIKVFNVASPNNIMYYNDNLYITTTNGIYVLEKESLDIICSVKTNFNPSWSRIDDGRLIMYHTSPFTIINLDVAQLVRDFRIGPYQFDKSHRKMSLEDYTGSGSISNCAVSDQGITSTTAYTISDVSVEVNRKTYI